MRELRELELLAALALSEFGKDWTEVISPPHYP